MTPMTSLFVLAILMVMIAAGSQAFAQQASFAEFDRRATEGERLNVVFFGGSLTWGANASDPQLTSYRARMADHLREKYPKAAFAFYDAAIGGTGSKLGMFRLERDVLSRKPDLVFLDFSANDDLTGTDVITLRSYEQLLREMIGRGTPVVQVFFGFKSNFGKNWNPEKLTRVIEHRKLAAAYNTGVGDSLPHIQEKLTSGQADINTLWPFDGAHPDDAGYALFAEAVRDGFSQAIADKRVCTVPAKPLYGEGFPKRTRLRLSEQKLPAGWKVKKPFRTSLYFDGMPSRWMDDVAYCDSKDRDGVEPLVVEFQGSFVALFGQADPHGLGFTVELDGKPLTFKPNAKTEPTPVWNFNTQRLTNAYESGRLFVFRQIADDLEDGPHTLKITPVWPAEGQPAGQLHIESICTAGR